jgi:hypothetical protein
MLVCDDYSGDQQSLPKLARPLDHIELDRPKRGSLDFPGTAAPGETID